MKPVQVSKQERRRLEKLVNQRTAPVGLVRRAKAILMLHDGYRPVDVADVLGLSDRWVRKWRARWQTCRHLESLYEQDRPGRPAVISLQTRCQVVKIACSSPEQCGILYRATWTQELIAAQLEQQTAVKISRSSVQRILSAEGFRPHPVRLWLHSPDPDFQTKVTRICDLYTCPPADAVVLCIDEKPMQALSRRHPTTYDRGEVRYEYEYKRHGTQVLLGAFNIQTGQVFGRVVAHRNAATLVAFMQDVARQYPDKQVYVVWDNLNIHHEGKDQRWEQFNKRHGGRFHFVHTPLHASWMNQIEIWFSILHRRVLRHGSFCSKKQQRECIEGYIQFWNDYEAHAFHWKFSGQFEERRSRSKAA